MRCPTWYHATSVVSVLWFLQIRAALSARILDGVSEPLSLPFAFQDSLEIHLESVNVRDSALIAYSRSPDEDGDSILLMLRRLDHATLQFSAVVRRPSANITEFTADVALADGTSPHRFSLRRVEINESVYTLEVVVDSDVILIAETPAFADDPLMASAAAVHIGGIASGHEAVHSERDVLAIAPLAACVLSVTRDGVVDSSLVPAGPCTSCRDDDCSANGGVCFRSGSGRKGCDCRGTGFGGEKCLKEESPISFIGERCSTLRLAAHRQLPRDISLRVKFEEDASGVLLDSRHLTISVAELRLAVQVPGRGATTSQQLYPGVWNTVTVRVGEAVTEVRVNGVLAPGIEYAGRAIRRTGSHVTVGCLHAENSTDARAVTSACLQQLEFGGRGTDSHYRLFADDGGQPLPGGEVVRHHGGGGGGGPTGAYPKCYALRRTFVLPVQFVTRDSRLDLVGSYRGGSLFFSFRTVRQSGDLAAVKTGSEFLRVYVSCGVVWLGSGSALLESSVPVSDDQFHSVRVERVGCRLALTVDGQRVLSANDRSCFHGLRGGALRLGSALDDFPVGFVGCMKEVLVDDLDQGLSILADTTAGVLRGCGNDDTCDKCQNGGGCRRETTEVTCDCATSNGFSGPECAERSIVATFSNTELRMRPSRQPRRRDCLGYTTSLHVRPADSNPTHGQLLAIPTGTATLFRIGLNSSMVTVQYLDESFENLGLRLDGGQWNKVSVRHTHDRTLTVTVNGVSEVRHTRAAHVSYFYSELRLGGPGGSQQLARNESFVGCIRNVYDGDLDVLQDAYDSMEPGTRDLMRYEEPFFSRSCEHRLFSCPDSEILLSESGTHLSFNLWSAVSQAAVSLEMATDEKDGVILSSVGDDGGHFFLLVLDGQACVFAARPGARHVRACSGRGLNDAATHTVLVEWRRGQFHLHVDRLPVVSAEPPTSSLAAAGTPAPPPLHLDSRLLVGSGYSMCNSNRSYLAYRNTAVPLVQGFAGCIRRLKINGMCSSSYTHFQCSSSNAPPVPAMYRAYGNFQRGTVFSSCNQNFCDLDNVCRHGGRCYLKVTHLACICRGTGYRGAGCEEPSPAITFPCNHYAVMAISAKDSRPALSDKVPALVLGFRSYRQTETIMVAALRDAAGRYLIQILQENDTIVLQSKLDEFDLITKRSSPVPSLQQFMYHIVQVYFTATEVSVFITMKVYKEDIAGEPLAVVHFAHQEFSVEIDQVQIAMLEIGSFRAESPDFIPASPLCGHFRTALFNDVALIEEVLKDSGNVTSNAIMNEDALDNYTIFVAAPRAYKHIPLAPVRAVQFSFRTNGAQNSILLALHGTAADNSHILVMIVDGKLVIESQSGGGAVSDEFRLGRNFYTSDHWLLLRIKSSRSLEAQGANLTVSVLANNEIAARRFDYFQPSLLGDFQELDIGGASIQPKLHPSVHEGFTGCIEVLEVNGAFVDLPAATTRGNTSLDDITAGCPACVAERACHAGRCRRAAESDAKDSATQLKCDCEETGFTGEVCNETIPTEPPTTKTTITTTLKLEPTTEAPKTTPAVPTQKPTTVATDKAATVVTEKPDDSRGGTDGSGASSWLPAVIILLLILLALLLALLVYAVMRYRRRYTGLYGVDETEVSLKGNKGTMI